MRGEQIKAFGGKSELIKIYEKGLLIKIYKPELVLLTRIFDL